MLVIKRDGKEVEFDIDKIVSAISRASAEDNEMTPEQITEVANVVWKRCKRLDRAIGVDEIKDYTEDALIKGRYAQTAKRFIRYRQQRELNRKQNTTDAAILAIVNLENENVKQENANKDPEVASVQRDYIAGEISRDLTDRYFLPNDVKKAHEEGIIHFHKTVNCGLVQEWA